MQNIEEETNFAENSLLANQIENASPKPDFIYFFLDHFNQDELNELWNSIKTSKTVPDIFLKGLFYESGKVFEKDYEKALDFYK